MKWLIYCHIAHVLPCPGCADLGSKCDETASFLECELNLALQLQDEPPPPKHYLLLLHLHMCRN